MADRRNHLIFISYRGSDQNWATELVYARMTEAFGADAVFKAGNALRAGEEFPPVLRKEAASCPVMLACIGPGWLTATAPDGSRRLDSPDDWVREEIAISLQTGHHVLPLLIGNRTEAAVPEPDLMPEPIRALVHRQAVWLAPGGGLDATIPKLVDRLAELVPELARRRRDRSAAPPSSDSSRHHGSQSVAGTTAGSIAQVKDVKGNVRASRRSSSKAAGRPALPTTAGVDPGGGQSVIDSNISGGVTQIAGVGGDVDIDV